MVRSKAWLTFAFVVAIVILKLWLTSPIRTVPLYAPHDATNFVTHAHALLAGAWFGQYGSLTLIKGPFFPLYLAAISELGLSVNLAHQLTYLAACGIACIAVRPVVTSRGLLVAIGALLVFNPMTYDSFAWVIYRSQVSGTLSLLSVACAVAIVIRRDQSVRARLGWAIGLGFSLAAFWLTREEGVWIVPCIFLLATVAIIAAWRMDRQHGPSRAMLLVVPSGIWVGAILTIQAINGHAYGWAVTTEMQSSEFISAYASLQRIKHGPSEPTVPVPKAARFIAYRISPLAKALEPAIDGSTAERGWFRASCDAAYSCSDIAGGWFTWAFRGAVGSAGFYDTGSHARAFYLALAREIDTACERHTIDCDTKRASLAPRITGQERALLEHYLSGIQRFASISSFSTTAWEITDPPPDTVREYAFVTRDVRPIGTPYHAFDDRLKTAVLKAIAGLYQLVLPIALVLGCLMTALRILLSARNRHAVPDAHVLFAAVFASGITLIAILAIIDVLSFPGFNDEYFGALYSIAFLAIALLAATELESLKSLLVRRGH